jgi:hypothetical protein
MSFVPEWQRDQDELPMILIFLVLIGAVMYWRVGLALPDSLIAQWVIIGIAGYILGCGWFALCRRHPFAAIFVLGFLRVRLKTFSRITELSQHDADGGEFQECEGVAIEIFPVLGEAAATVEPRNRAFDDPTLG